MIDYSSVENTLDEITSFYERDVEAVVAQTVTYRIIDRTKKGEDVNGTRFIPYTEGYSAERKGWGFNTSPVDLYFLGIQTPKYPHTHMLESIILTNEHTLWFPEETLDIAIGNQFKREFFGVNISDINAAVEAAKLAIYNFNKG